MTHNALHPGTAIPPLPFSLRFLPIFSLLKLLFSFVGFFLCQCEGFGTKGVACVQTVKPHQVNL